MISSEFIKKIESYYGKYTPAVRRVVLQYLKTVPEEELPDIRRLLHLTVSTRFNHVPDVATIEQARKEVKSLAVGNYKPLLPDPEALGFQPRLGPLLKGLIKKLKKPGAKS